MADVLRRRAAWIFDRWRPLALGLGAFLVLNVAAHVFYIRDVVRVSGDRERIVAARRAELAKAEQRTVALERTVSKLACTRSDVRHLLEDVLSSKEERMTAILREVRQLARDNGMDPERVAYSVAPVGTGGLVEFRVTFPLEGPYEVLRKFIREVETSPNFLVIRDVALTGDRSQSQSLKFGVKMLTFFQTPDLQSLQAAFPGVSGPP